MDKAANENFYGPAPTFQEMLNYGRRMVRPKWGELLITKEDTDLMVRLIYSVGQDRADKFIAKMIDIRAIRHRKFTGDFDECG